MVRSKTGKDLKSSIRARHYKDYSQMAHSVGLQDCIEERSDSEEYDEDGKDAGEGNASTHGRSMKRRKRYSRLKQQTAGGSNLACRSD